MNFPSTEDSVNAILAILEDEARRLDANLKNEKSEKNNISNELIVSLKRSCQTFRITLSWKRDEHLDHASFNLGNGYIETQWRLILEPVNKAVPISPPFHWRLKSRDESIARSSHPRIMNEPWLRRMIRSKLAVLEES
jgi:hypothetical protein